MISFCRFSLFVAAMTLYCTPAAWSQVENSLAATGTQTHDSSITHRGTEQQSRYSLPQLPQARYALEAPSSLNQSAFPSASFDLGFRGGGGSGNGHFNGLPQVSTSSVDLSVVDGGGWRQDSVSTGSGSISSEGGKEQSGNGRSGGAGGLGGLFGSSGSLGSLGAVGSLGSVFGSNGSDAPWSEAIPSAGNLPSQFDLGSVTGGATGGNLANIGNLGNLGGVAGNAANFGGMPTGSKSFAGGNSGF